jgi:hypothetical protein
MSVLDDIAAERRRQIEAEGWTLEHDDAAQDGQLAGAAACYALTNVNHWARDQAVNTFWPWSRGWWKPRDARADLIRAAALLVAEIERLDRAATKPSLTGASTI